MLLAGMVLSNLVEEKANKIIEILAAAIPMDAVFIGKLFAMLGVSLVGIAVWGAVIGGLRRWRCRRPLGHARLRHLPEPGVGWPLFFVLGVAYFAMGYLLLGSVFLAIGSLATTVREVQTLSMPVTMAQVLLFFFASYAMAQPGEPVETAGDRIPASARPSRCSPARRRTMRCGRICGARLAGAVGGDRHPPRRAAVPQAGDEVRPAVQVEKRRGLFERRGCAAARIQPECTRNHRPRLSGNAMIDTARPPHLARLARRRGRLRFSPPAARPAAGEGFKVTYTDAEWRKRLTTAQYHILREEGTERPVQLAAQRRAPQGHLPVRGCDNELYSSARPSSTAAPAGRASGSRCPARSAPRPTSGSAIRAPKCIAPTAAGIWATCSRTAPSRPACATA